MRSLRSLVAICAIALVTWVAGAANAQVQANIFTVHSLVSDSTAISAAATDASLVNGWGLSAGPTTP